MSTETEVGVQLDEYKWGFSKPENYVFKARKGLSHEIVEEISEMKGEPQWMRDFRHKSLDPFLKRPMPTWGGDLCGIDFDNIYYYIKPTQEAGKTWDDLPAEIKDTFDQLGIPEAERKYLAGVGAQYESEVIYHKVREDLEKLGVIFVDPDTALREHEDLFRKYFGTIIPPNDNKFCGAQQRGLERRQLHLHPQGRAGSRFRLQAYFRINAQNMGQFERTLIIADEDSYVHYVEGCTAPTYTSDSLHSAVVEIIVKKNARVRYTTIQNWSKNVYNLVTKRAIAYEDATMEWVDGNLGSQVTMKYPAVWLMEPARARRGALGGLRVRRPAPGRGRQGRPRRAEHLVADHLEVDLEGHRAAPAIAACSRCSKGAHQRQVERALRRAAAGRDEPHRHLSLHRDRGRGRRDRPRGHRLQGWRGAALLPDEPRPRARPKPTR